MIRTLVRLLPRSEALALRALVAWFTVAAALQGVALTFAAATLAHILQAPAGTFWTTELTSLVASTVGVTIAFAVVQWFAQRRAFANGAARELHRQLGASIQASPVGDLTPTRQAELIDLATTGVPRLMSYPALLLRPAITAIVTPLTAALGVMVLDPLAGGVLTVAVLIGWCISRVAGSATLAANRALHATSTDTNRRMLEYVTAQAPIRSDDIEDDDLHRAIDASRAAAMRATRNVIPAIGAFAATVQILLAAIIAGGITLASLDPDRVPATVAIMIVAVRLAAVGSHGAELSAGLAMSGSIVARLAAVADAPALPVTPSADTTPERDVLVRVTGITTGYRNVELLADASFTLPRTGLTALVGASGSGKTTLGGLLARLHDPTAGEIRIDGTDLRSLRQDEVAARVALVMQHGVLLDATLAENLRIARPDATDAALWDALRQVRLEHHVQSLPEGLGTEVGPEGSALSGGQRQRVAIARAILRAAPLTVLDEPTSALDRTTAADVLAAIRSLASERSVLLITHDPAAVAAADRVLELRDRTVSAITAPPPHPVG